jgi:hypothetical protein
LNDNLFDQVQVVQDTAAPLNFSNNGYWPLSTNALTWDAFFYPWSWIANSAKLQPTNSGHYDVTLGNAPPYQAGPFGNFYLPTNTVLYGAGSRTPASAGLYHYSTRLDQVKEGNETAGHNVNIGVHYVATAGPGSSQPNDYDGDGIFDYVENWHGDGQFHNDGTDTDWQHNYSTVGPDGMTLVADPSSPVYDDIDLSGDGLVGRIKNALGMSPFDPSNPLAPTQVITGQEPDIATFELPISYNALTNIGGLNLNLDGFDVTAERCALATDGTNTLLTWNTTYDPPGPHFLQPRLTLNGTGVDTAILTGLGRLVPFYSANVCRFFESDALFDQSGAYLDAQLRVPNANYSIQLYDPSTTPPTLLKTIGPNSTSSGMIQEDWDLTCDNTTNLFAGSAFDAVFDVTLLDAAAQTPIAHGTPTKRHNMIVTTEQGNNGQGNGFDVAYMYTPRDSTLADSFYHGPVWIGMQGVVDTLTQPLWPWPSPGHYDSSFDWFTSPDHLWGYPGYAGSMATITGFLYPSMSDGLTKNFYCHAHGTANNLQNYAGDVQITAGVVAALLGNQGFPGFPFAVNPSYPYRFVFLDGCSTASDNQWRHAFGIMPLGPRGQAARSKLGAQAFVGWSAPVPDLLGGIPDKGNIDVNESMALQSAYSATLQFFFSEWMNGKPLIECIMDASKPGPYVPCPLPSWGVNHITIGPPFASTSFEVNFNDPRFVGKLWIYGHPGLTRNGLKPEIDYSVPGIHAPGNIQ